MEALSGSMTPLLSILTELKASASAKRPTYSLLGKPKTTLFQQTGVSSAVSLVVRILASHHLLDQRGTRVRISDRAATLVTFVSLLPFIWIYQAASLGERAPKVRARRQRVTTA